jgi:hypothetical protein
LRGKINYADKKELTAIFSLNWEFQFQFLKIFKLMEYVIQSILEYSNIIKELIKHLAKLFEYSIWHCILYVITDQI